MGLFGNDKRAGGAFEFRVSDAVEVPLRGFLLRLKLVNGEPSIRDIAPGKAILLRAPGGAEREITIKDYSATQGRASQKRFDRTHELDVVIEAPDGIVNGESVDIGWTVASAK